MSRVEELRERRESLIARSAALRMQMTVHGNELEASLVRVDRGIHMVRSLSAKPLVLAGGAALLVMLGPARALGWLSRGLFYTSMARRVYGLVAPRRWRRGRDEGEEQHQLFV